MNAVNEPAAARSVKPVNIPVPPGMAVLKLAISRHGWTGAAASQR
jgi:hypothetical protein